ncbi:MAG: hypothetical protein V4525_11610 [Pseudomonadota bacterium]
MNIKKNINSDYQNHINGLNNRANFKNLNYSDENYNFNTFDDESLLENQERKKRIRILLAFLMLVLLILGGYFYWVSKELDKIQQPSILMINQKVSIRFSPVYLANYQAILLYKKLFNININVNHFLKKGVLLKRLQKSKNKVNVSIK